MANLEFLGPGMKKGIVGKSTAQNKNESERARRNSLAAE